MNHSVVNNDNSQLSSFVVLRVANSAVLIQVAGTGNGCYDHLVTVETGGSSVQEQKW